MRTRSRRIKAITTVGSEQLVAKVWPLLHEAVEVGVTIGWNRAHKHTDTPEPAAIQDAIHDAVMHEIAERFDILPES